MRKAVGEVRCCTLTRFTGISKLAAIGWKPQLHPGILTPVLDTQKCGVASIGRDDGDDGLLIFFTEFVVSGLLAQKACHELSAAGSQSAKPPSYAPP